MFTPICLIPLVCYYFLKFKSRSQLNTFCYDDFLPTCSFPKQGESRVPLICHLKIILDSSCAHHIQSVTKVQWGVFFKLSLQFSPSHHSCPAGLSLPGAPLRCGQECFLFPVPLGFHRVQIISVHIVTWENRLKWLNNRWFPRRDSLILSRVPCPRLSVLMEQEKEADQLSHLAITQP